jgi:DNA-binding CsgD family transcriptional regulator
LLDKVFEFGRRRDDLFVLVNAAGVLARLHIARGDCSKAAAATAAYDTSKASILYGEYLSVRAVVLATLGATEEARAAVSAVPDAASRGEAQAFAELAQVILACHENDDALASAHQAITRIKTLGQIDPFVTACRAFPSLVELAIHSGNADFTSAVLRRSNDVELGRRYGLRINPVAEATRSVLSRREEQVLDLVSEGRTNEEVAGLLFISPVTVKAHLRHIYEKLGVRNRVEAVTRLAKERAPEPR